MQAELRTAATPAPRLPPVVVTLLVLAYLTVVGAADWCLPRPMNLGLFYLLGVAIAGWEAGRWPALLLASVSVGFILFHEWNPGLNQPMAWSMILWNASARLIGFCGVAWLVDKVACLTRTLECRVAEQTAQWKTEAERHQETSQQLAETLQRLEEDVAQRRRAEEALRRSEARYRTLAEASPDAIFTLDRKLEVEYMNSAAAGLWQRSPADLMGKTQTALFPPETARHHCAVLQRVLAGEIVEPRDERVPFPGGERWLETRLVRMAGEPGETISVLGVSRDVTERKRTEFVLQAQRDVSESLSLSHDLKTALDRLLGIAVQLEGVDSGTVYLLDPQTGELHLAAHRGLSEAFIQHASQYSPDTEQSRLIVSGRPFYGTHAELPGWRDPVRDQEGLRGLAVLPLFHEGHVVGSLNLASHACPFIAPQTRLVMEAIAVQAAGAIARIRTAEALGQSEARLRMIVAGLPIVLFALDREGIFTFEDGQALAGLGVQPGARVGRSALEAYRQFPVMLDNLRRALHGEAHSALVRLGSHVFDCCYSPARNAAGEVTGCIGVATDVTQAQRLEQQILEISDREQARIGQDIHDGLCQQLVSLAFDANALERHLAEEAHPATSTASRIALLLDQAITESRQLARGLFPVRLELDGLPVALEELARTARDRYGLDCGFAQGRPVTIPSQAMGTHLYRIAQEAVTNAVRHAQAHRLSILLLGRPGQLELRIEDDGVGLSPEQRAQAKGMGLHIMGYRARTVGGTLRVSRRPGGGTAVCCCVPMPPQ